MNGWRKYRHICPRIIQSGPFLLIYAGFLAWWTQKCIVRTENVSVRSKIILNWFFPIMWVGLCYMWLCCLPGQVFLHRHRFASKISFAGWGAYQLRLTSLRHQIQVLYCIPSQTVVPEFDDLVNTYWTISLISGNIYQKIGEFKKWEFSFSIENNSMWTSFDKKLVTEKVTTKMSKLVDNACLWRKKLNFIFFISLFWGIALISPDGTALTSTFIPPDHSRNRNPVQFSGLFRSGHKSKTIFFPNSSKDCFQRTDSS